MIVGLRASHRPIIGVDPDDRHRRCAGLHCTHLGSHGGSPAAAFVPPALERALRPDPRPGVRPSRALPSVPADDRRSMGSVLRTGAKVDARAARALNPHHPKRNSPSSVLSAKRRSPRPARPALADLVTAPGTFTTATTVPRDSSGCSSRISQAPALGSPRCRSIRRCALWTGPSSTRRVFASGSSTRQRVDYALKVPMWQSLGLLPVIADRKRWTWVIASQCLTGSQHGISSSTLRSDERVAGLPQARLAR